MYNTDTACGVCALERALVNFVYLSLQYRYQILLHLCHSPKETFIPTNSLQTSSIATQERYIYLFSYLQHSVILARGSPLAQIFQNFHMGRAWCKDSTFSRLYHWIHFYPPGKVIFFVVVVVFYTNVTTS